MQQITLELDNNEDDRPGPVMEPEREQQLIALMTQIIVTIVQNDGRENHESD